jgi:hypothetical protein
VGTGNRSAVDDELCQKGSGGRADVPCGSALSGAVRKAPLARVKLLVVLGARIVVGPLSFP